jgi:hypothetical protein
MIFEHFAFRSALVAPAPALVAHDPLLARPDAAGGAAADVHPGAAAALRYATASAVRARAALVLDCGFSYTCVTLLLLCRFCTHLRSHPHPHPHPHFFFFAGMRFPFLMGACSWRACGASTSAARR